MVSVSSLSPFYELDDSVSSSMLLCREIVPGFLMRKLCLQLQVEYCASGSSTYTQEYHLM